MIRDNFAFPCYKISIITNIAAETVLVSRYGSKYNSQ